MFDTFFERPVSRRYDLNSVVEALACNKFSIVADLGRLHCCAKAAHFKHMLTCLSCIPKAHCPVQAACHQLGVGRYRPCNIDSTNLASMCFPADSFFPPM